MSTAHDDTLYLRPFAEIDTHPPDFGLQALPGRIAALTHPLNKGREIVLPDRETYDPDVCTIVSSGVEGFGRGDVVVLAPDHGAFYPGLSPDGRELRIVGVVKPWWESTLAKFSGAGVAPGPGWMLVDRAECRVLSAECGGIALPDSVSEFGDYGTVVASCGDGWSSPYEGERVCIQGLRTYTFREVVPKSWVLVRAPIASKLWLSSLQRAI